MTKAKVFLVEDHPITRRGLTQLIDGQVDMQVCGWAEDAAGAIRGIDESRPALVVADLSLKGIDGLEFIKQVRQKSPGLYVLIFSMHDESLYAQRALRAGARGYIMKAEAPEKLLTAVRKTLRGEIYLSEGESARALANLFGSSAVSPKLPIEQLSDRELEVFRRIGEGCNTREIAECLHLSVKTVETHCSHIKTKLKVKNSRELARQAVLWLDRDGR